MFLPLRLGQTFDDLFYPAAFLYWSGKCCLRLVSWQQWGWDHWDCVFLLVGIRAGLDVIDFIREAKHPVLITGAVLEVHGTQPDGNNP